MPWHWVIYEQPEKYCEANSELSLKNHKSATEKLSY